MNQLEHRYRRVLRLLPTAYRQRWEEDMVAAFLTSMEVDDPERAEYLADFGRPSWPEVASVAGLAVRLHMGLAGGRSPRTLARSQSLRIVILLWLLSGAVWAVVGAGVQLWLVGALSLLSEPPSEWAAAASAIGPWQVALQVGGLTWLVAYLALLHGYPAVARAAALLGVATNAVGIVLAVVDEVVRNLPSLSISAVAMFCVDVTLLAALWMFAKGWPPVRRDRWSLALVAGVSAMAALTAAAIAGVLPWWALEPVSVGSIAVLVILGVRMIAGMTPSWLLAIAALAWGMVVLRVVTLPDVAEAESWNGPAAMTFAVAEASGLLAAAVPLAVLAARAQRRLASS